jgi:hypothetical protein
MTFSNLEQADRFLRMLLLGREGKPLLTLDQDARADVVVSGMWEDPLGASRVVFEDNQTIWSSNPALVLTVRKGSAELMLDDELLWRMAVDSRKVTVEGLFFADHGMVALTPWGYMGWTAEEFNRVLTEALSDIATDALDPLPDPLRVSASTRLH